MQRLLSLRHVPGGLSRSMYVAPVLALACSLSLNAHAQTFVNAGFESGTTGWTGCLVEVNPANVYGGTGSSMVAEVDGDNNAGSTADDMLLCQSVSGFTIGSVYTLDFDAARRQGGPTPTTVSANVQMDNALDVTVSRTGAWNMVREHLTFTATATTHNLRITPNFTVSYGMLFDNFSITLVSMLPVELLHFDARSEGSAVQLNWVTATEHNSAAFAVDRSTDGLVWTTIARLPAAGNSQSALDYSTRDDQPVHGLSYYRLTQVDLDGTQNTTDARSVFFTDAGGPVLWPNPAVEEVNVRWPTDFHKAVEVYNSMGQWVPVVLEQSGANTRMHVGGLPSGTYMVRGKNTGESIARFLKL